MSLHGSTHSGPWYKSNCLSAMDIVHSFDVHSSSVSPKATGSSSSMRLRSSGAVAESAPSSSLGYTRQQLETDAASYTVRLQPQSPTSVLPTGEMPADEVTIVELICAHDGRCVHRGRQVLQVYIVFAIAGHMLLDHQIMTVWHRQAACAFVVAISHIV